MQQIPMLHDVKVKITNKSGKACIEPCPPEEIFVNAGSGDITITLPDVTATAEYGGRTKITRLEAMVKAEAARADAWMDFADALHKGGNARPSQR